MQPFSPTKNRNKGKLKKQRKNQKRRGNRFDWIEWKVDEKGGINEKSRDEYRNCLCKGIMANYPCDPCKSQAENRKSPEFVKRIMNRDNCVIFFRIFQWQTKI